MESALLILGSNLDNRFQLIEQAKEMLIIQIGEIVKYSSIYETPPWGFKSENSFLNQVVELSTKLPPNEILEKCLLIEEQLGRVRSKVGDYTDRTIDIDILLYNDLIISSDSLVIPHPRMHERLFCMEPLREICPERNIPSLQKKVIDVYNNCPDKSQIIKLDV